MNERKLIARVSKDFTCYERLVQKEKRKKKKKKDVQQTARESITDKKYIEFIGSVMWAPVAS